MDAASHLDLDLTLLDVSSLEASQTGQFNDLRFLNEWFAEQVNHYGLSLTPGCNQEMLDGIAEKYGTDYFLWTGVISLKKKKSVTTALLLLGLSYYYWPTLAYTVWYAAKPEHEMMHYAILFDLRTGKRDILKFEFFRRKDTDSLLKAHLFDTFFQIKTKKKEEKKAISTKKKTSQKS